MGFGGDKLSLGEGRCDVAGVTGLEPAASGVTGRRSNQLSYTPKLLDCERFTLRLCPCQARRNGNSCPTERFKSNLVDPVPPVEFATFK